MENIILAHKEIAHKTKRIAYQIFETFVNEEEVILAGIANNGYLFAQKIAAELALISDLKVTLCEVKINKQNPQSPVTTSIPSAEYQNKALVLIDDVLSTGTT
jgi:pyrimidine operon attenuation protein/uracil phosphoribosyltransferase